MAPVSANGVVNDNAVALVFVTVTVALAVPPAGTETEGGVSTSVAPSYT